MQHPCTSLGHQDTHLSPHLDKCFGFGALLACLVKGDDMPGQDTFDLGVPGDIGSRLLTSPSIGEPGREKKDLECLQTHPPSLGIPRVV